MKKCSRCQENKTLISFNKNKSKKDGLSTECKDCLKDLRILNPRKQDSNYHKEYYIKNRDKLIEKSIENAIKNKENRKAYLKKYHKENYTKKRDEKRDYYIKWNIENKDYYNNRSKKLRKENPIERLKHNLRNRTYNAFSRNYWKKDGGTEKLLGSDFKTVKKHLEKQFSKGMTWSNYGKWHIDHIVPLSKAKTKEELKKLCHYSNLQPLWAFDNLSKGNREDEVKNYAV